MARHAAACPHAALRKGLSGRRGAGGLQGLLHMSLLHGQRLCIVEPAVIALENQRVERRQISSEFGNLRQRVADQRRADDSGGKGRGQGNRRFDRAQLLHLHQPRTLAKAIDDRQTCRYLFQEKIAGLRQNDGDAALYGPRVQRAMADGNAGNIVDRIQRPAR